MQELSKNDSRLCELQLDRSLEDNNRPFFAILMHPDSLRNRSSYSLSNCTRTVLLASGNSRFASSSKVTQRNGNVAGA